MRLISRRRDTYITNRILQGVIALKYTSYVHFAEVVGLSDTTIRNYVNKGMLPSPAIQKTIASALGVPAAYLFHTLELSQRKDKNVKPVLKSHEYVFPKTPDFPIGVRKPRFRQTEVYQVVRPVLYALLLAENIKLSELATYLGVTPRMVMNYIYTGAEPKTDRVYSLEELFNLPIECIMYKTDMN